MRNINIKSKKLKYIKPKIIVKKINLNTFYMIPEDYLLNNQSNPNQMATWLGYCRDPRWPDSCWWST